MSPGKPQRDAMCRLLLSRFGAAVFCRSPVTAPNQVSGLKPIWFRSRQDLYIGIASGGLATMEGHHLGVITTKGCGGGAHRRCCCCCCYWQQQLRQRPAWAGGLQKKKPSKFSGHWHERHEAILTSASWHRAAAAWLLDLQMLHWAVGIRFLA